MQNQILRLIGPAVVLATLLGPPAFGAGPPGDRERPLREAVWGGRWMEGVRIYGGLAAAGPAPSPQASYLAGVALWKLRRLEEARPLLRKADEAGFRATGGRPQPGELLARIATYFELRPPRIDVPGLEPSAIEAYSEARTPLTAPVLDALPRFVEIGRRLFGEPVPILFFSFARLPGFERFYALFQEGRAAPTGTAHSTGGVNMVLFCEEKAHRGTTAETVSLALHETMHAWIATYLRRTYDRPLFLPPYADEGLATYVAGLWSPEVGALPAQRLEQWRRWGLGAPPFSDLRTDETFRAPGRELPNYWLSEQLIERLLGPPEKGAAKIRAFLDAWAPTGDDLAAWREVSGKDAETEYAALAAGPKK